MSKDYLYILAKDAFIDRIGRGLYQWPDYQLLEEVCKRVLKVVVALISALNFHEITTQNPHQIFLAIDRR